MKKTLILLITILLICASSLSAFADTDTGLNVSYSYTDNGTILVTASVVDIKVEGGLILVGYDISYDETALELLNSSVNIPDAWEQYLNDLEGPDTELSELIEPGEYFWCIMIFKVGCGITEDNQLSVTLEFKPLKNEDTDIEFKCSDLSGEDLDQVLSGESKILNIVGNASNNIDTPNGDISDDVIVDNNNNGNNNNNNFTSNEGGNQNTSNDSSINSDNNTESNTENSDTDNNDKTESVSTDDELIGVTDPTNGSNDNNTAGIIVTVIYGILLLCGLVLICVKFSAFKQFVKENSSVIVKFLLTHVVMSILGIMVGLALLGIEGDVEGISAIAIIGSAFTIGFMCFMHYDDMYFVAVKEGIRERAEGKKLDLLKGLKITLIAYSPVIIVGFIAIAVNAFAGNVENAAVVPMLIYYILQGSYLGLYKLRLFFGLTGYILITLMPALVAGTLAYALGLKDKTLRGLFGMKVKPPYDGPVEKKNKNKK